MPPVPIKYVDPAIGKSLGELLAVDREKLNRGGVEITSGDERCILFGHVARAAISDLAAAWAPDVPTQEKLTKVERKFTELIRSLRIGQSDQRVAESVAASSGPR